MITQAELHRRLHYFPETGELIWMVGTRTIAPFTPAGWTDADGYLLVRLAGKLYQGHRLIWFYMTGEWPRSGFIDHIDLNPSNNRWVNLRDATKRVNQENRRVACRNNKSGFLGVSPNGKRFAATIGSRGHHYYLGTFDTPELAHDAYVAAKRQLHEGCTL